MAMRREPVRQSMLSAWRKLGVALVCALGGVGTGLAALAPSATPLVARHALVIGNSDYKNVPKLDNPGNDSKDLCAALKKLDFATTCAANIKSRGEFKDTVLNFTRNIKKGDVALFYYAGHGIEMGGENYLVPTTAQFRSRAAFEDDGVRVNFILDELGATGSSLTIVILDACRDNPFGAKGRSAGGGQGLGVQTYAPSGSIIIFPTDPGKKALDSDGGSRNGLFTKHLLSHIATPMINIETMMKRVIEDVKAESTALGMPQNPWNSSSFSGEFCFAGCVDLAAQARERTALEAKAKDLEEKLRKQQQMSDSFVARLREMESRLAMQQQEIDRTTPEFRRLETERKELAGRLAMLERQDEGIKKAQQALTVYQSSQDELAAIEKELKERQARLKKVDIQLAQTRGIKTGARDLKGELAIEEGKIAALRQERDQLKQEIELLTRKKKSLEDGERELEKIAKITRDAEQANAELARFKERLASLEQEAVSREQQLQAERDLRQKTEAKLKDAKTEAVKDAARVAPAF